MLNKMLRVGIIGYGYASQTFHIPLIIGTPGLELAAISSSNEQKVKKDWPNLAVVDSAQKLFSDERIDLIIIPTPNDTHFPLAQQALAAGKHVVVDKPFAVTVSQAKALKQQAQQLGKVLSIFHNRRWDSDFLTLKSLLTENILGEIVYLESHFDRYRPQVRTRWREQQGEGSGLWYDLGPHLIDQALLLFGKPQSLWVDLGKLRPTASAVDYFHAVLSYSKSRVVLHSSMLAAAQSPRFIVHGTLGSFVKFGLDPQEECLKATGYSSQKNWGHDKREGIVTLSHEQGMEEKHIINQPGNYPAYYAAIRDAILGIGPNPVTATEAIAVMELIELGIESAAQQRAFAVL